MSQLPYAYGILKQTTIYTVTLMFNAIKYIQSTLNLHEISHLRLSFDRKGLNANLLKRN